MVEYAQVMDQRNKVIIFGGVSLLILAGVLVSLFYILKSSKVSKITQPLNTPNSLSRLPSAVVTSSNSISPSVASTNPNIPVTLANDKIFQGRGFSLSYPKEWGILTCSNSV